MKDSHRLPQAIRILAIVVLAGCAGFYFWELNGGIPSTKGLGAQARKEELKVEIETQIAKKDTAIAKSTIKATTWSGEADKVGPQAFAKLSKLATQYKVKLAALRPQKQAMLGEVSTIPFLLSLEGSSTGVIQMIRAIEKPETRLAVSLVQINAGDEGADTVSANVGIVAYLEPKANPVPDDKATGNKESKRA